MRDATKAIIGFGCIWGLWAFGAALIGSFTLGANDSYPEVVAMLLYGFTILPACILSIWYRRYAAVWLVGVSLVATFGFIYQTTQVHRESSWSFWSFVGKIVQDIVLGAIPGLLGVLLLRGEPDKNNS